MERVQEFCSSIVLRLSNSFTSFFCLIEVFPQTFYPVNYLRDFATCMACESF
jgi:hypothetical protein